MLPFILALVYLLACIGCGYLGRNTVVGSVGSFLLAIVFSPLLVLGAIFLFARYVPRRVPKS